MDPRHHEIVVTGKNKVRNHVATRCHSDLFPKIRVVRIEHRDHEFLVQEIYREANTIGSKTPSADVTHVVVDMKSELEKVREQSQNLQ